MDESQTLPLSRLIFIADKSGSMREHINDTKGSLMSFLDKQRAQVDPMSKVDIYTFNGSVVNVFSGLISDNIDFPYDADGCTALYDAIGHTITNTINSLTKLDGVPKPDEVYIIILTDGEENSSSKYTKGAISELISSQEKAGWKFIFMGANQDAILSGGNIGLKAGACLNYSQNVLATECAMDSINNAINRVRSKESTSVNFSQIERSMSSQIT